MSLVNFTKVTLKNRVDPAGIPSVNIVYFRYFMYYVLYKT